MSICVNALKQSCILVQRFCPLGIKITQFPGGFLLNYIYDKMLLHLGPYMQGHLLHLGLLHMPRLDRSRQEENSMQGWFIQWTKLNTIRYDNISFILKS